MVTELPVRYLSVETMLVPSPWSGQGRVAKMGWVPVLPFNFLLKFL